MYLTFFAVDMIDDPHGGHVINPGIEPDLIEDDDPPLSCFLIQGTHLGLDIGCGHHIFSLLQAYLSNHDVKSIWQ